MLELITPVGHISTQCPKRNLRFVHEHDKNDDFLPFLFMNTTEMAL
jgi:hypothetical protein